MDEKEAEVEKGEDIAQETEPDHVHDAGELPGGEDEGQAPRALRAPRIPSAREVESHELSRCPPRSWCDHCVRGQAKDRPRTKISGEYADSSIVRVSMD